MVKILTSTLVCLSVLTTIPSCKPQPEVPSDKGIVVQQVSTDYKPASFVTDKRKEKITALAPQIHKFIEEHAGDRHIPGVAYGIVVDDELVIASATGYIDIDLKLPATTHSAFRIASMTKSLTAMAILKLRDEGKLRLDDPAARYIPEMTELEYLTSDSPPIDIQNLLTMTAGFPEDNPWGDRQLDEPDQMLIDLLINQPSLSNPPSIAFEYSNTGYALLGLIIARVSGSPYQEYIRKSILQPLNMNHTYWEYDMVPTDLLARGYRWEDNQWKPEPMLHDGSYGAMGGLITTIEDFSKYVGFLLSAWPPRNDPDTGPVRRNTLREMQSPHFPRLESNGRDWNGEPCPGISGYGYGLGIYQYCNGLRQVSHGGALPGYGSHYVFYPEYGIGVMAFGNLTYTRPYNLEDILRSLFESIELEPRQLPASDILKERQQQITQLIQTWDPELETKILAENFYLDWSRESRMAEARKILDQAGNIRSIGLLQPYNQLRGSYDIACDNGIIHMFFTLTPENIPRIQQLNIDFELN